MKHIQGTLLLALMLATAAPAFADTIPGHSKGGNSYVSFSEGFAAQQDSQSSSARCNFFLGSVREMGSQTSSMAGASSGEIAKGEKDSERGASLGAGLGSAGLGSDGHSVKLIDFGAGQGASSEKEKNKNKDRTYNGGDGDGNGTGSGSGVLSPTIPVAEPGSQTLLLFGLAGLGMLFACAKR